MSNGRGSWSVAAGVKARWDDAGLSTLFKSEWPDPTTTQYLAFNDGEARPAKDGTNHPRPYCIVEQGEPIRVEGSSGTTSTTKREIQDVPLQFTVYATTKTKAKQFASQIANAFDTARLTLDDDDGHVDTLRDPDFSVREDDKTWAWVLQYRIRIDVGYNAALS